MTNAARPAPVIAIDGPTASGKGTIAAGVARRLGFHYLDSGSLYRLVALDAERTGADLDDAAALAAIAAGLRPEFRDGRIWLHGRRWCACSISSGRRRAWLPTGVTWAPPSFPTPS